MRQAIAIRHVHFEDLGIFEGVLHDHNFRVDYYDVGVNSLWALDERKADLLVVLGGPIGVYELESFPMIQDELDLLRERLLARRPTLGICLGAQLIAAALDARVYYSGTKEIGFAPVDLTISGRASPLRHLSSSSVLHWHGDTFDLPYGSSLLASTPACAHQAFSIGSNILGLQFHCEVDIAKGIERWLIGHVAELSAAGVSPATLRAQAEDVRSIGGAKEMLSEWLAGLDTVK